MYAIMEYNHVLNVDQELARGETLQEAFEVFEKIPHEILGMLWIKRVA